MGRTILIKQLKELPRDERLQKIDELFEESDRMPSAEMLDQLADAILHEELSDKHVDKMSRYEYPIMSARQLGRRKEGKERHRNRLGTVIREVPISHARNVATNGRDYTRPVRSFHNPF